MPVQCTKLQLGAIHKGRPLKIGTFDPLPPPVRAMTSLLLHECLYFVHFRLTSSLALPRTSLMDAPYNVLGMSLFSHWKLTFLRFVEGFFTFAVTFFGRNSKFRESNNKFQNGLFYQEKSNTTLMKLMWILPKTWGKTTNRQSGARILPGPRVSSK